MCFLNVKFLNVKGDDMQFYMLLMGLFLLVGAIWSNNTDCGILANIWVVGSIIVGKIDDLEK